MPPEMEQNEIPAILDDRLKRHAPSSSCLNSFDLLSLSSKDDSQIMQHSFLFNLNKKLIFCSNQYLSPLVATIFIYRDHLKKKKKEGNWWFDLNMPKDWSYLFPKVVDKH